MLLFQLQATTSCTRPAWWTPQHSKPKPKRVAWTTCSSKGEMLMFILQCDSTTKIHSGTVFMTNAVCMGMGLYGDTNRGALGDTH